MDIRQISIRYRQDHDRILVDINTGAGGEVQVWLTRRMVRQLWGPLTLLVTQAAVAQVVPHALVLPEAREMMAQAARSRQLPGADFATPFDPKPAAQPLGPEPLLPTTVDLSPGPDGRGLRLTVKEPGGRNLSLQLSNDLATGLMRLLEKALAEADWGLGPVAQQAQNLPGEAAPKVPPVVLN